MDARDLIGSLALEPHPEGGWYREIYRSRIHLAGPHGKRSALTTIYYLLERGQASRWHVVASDEIWHFYHGAPLELLAYDPDCEVATRQVLDHPTAGREPVAIIPAGVWQAARTLGDYSLLGCSVAPGFEFGDFRFVAHVPQHERHFAERLKDLRDLL
ncbi:MAG TPA: cupin domain-containing protein [Steroidobacteraceae bacterium]|nr:cupin domain-containing protein [Steroidobacteraceae bacterium]